MDAVQRHNAQVLKELEPGDMVEFPRGMYSHWGVYVGNDNIIHLSGRDNDGINANAGSLSNVFTICGKSYDKAYVCEDLFWNVVQGCKARKNNDKDRKVTPRGALDIIRQARSMLGKIGYNVLWNNCEHFAAFCRYGKKWSEQADTFFTGVAVAGALAVVGGLLWQAWKGDGQSNNNQFKK